MKIDGYYCQCGEPRDRHDYPCGEVVYVPDLGYWQARLEELEAAITRAAADLRHALRYPGTRVIEDVIARLERLTTPGAKP